MQHLEDMDKETEWYIVIGDDFGHKYGPIPKDDPAILTESQQRQLDNCTNSPPI